MKIKNDLRDLPRARLEEMDAAGSQILESYRLLQKTNANLVGQCLAHQGTFYELNHYPSGDVYDAETSSQYYYHSHRPELGEHGHFHTFLRADAIPTNCSPAPYQGEAERPSGKDAITALVAISMNSPGFPIALFTTNRWVTNETFYPADQVVGILDRFRIDHTYPCHAVNVWITAMFRLFRPHIEALLYERDRVIEEWAENHPGKDVYEDRELVVTSFTTIDVPKQIARVKRALKHEKIAA